MQELSQMLQGAGVKSPEILAGKRQSRVKPIVVKVRDIGDKPSL